MAKGSKGKDQAPEEGQTAVPDQAAERMTSDDTEVAAPATLPHDQPEPEPEPEPNVSRSGPPPAAPARRGGFWPGVLGGLIVSALGLGAGWWLFAGQEQEVMAFEARLAAQERALSDLVEQAAVPAPGPDLAPLEDDIAALRADLVSRAGELTAALDEIRARVQALELAPEVNGASAVAAVRDDDELQRLRAGLDALATRVDDIAESLDQRDDDLRAEIIRATEEAESTATGVLRAAAVARIGVALDTGAPFAEALAEAAGDNPPPTLAALADDGAPMLSDLRAAFPEAARAALATARDEGLAEDGEGIGGFLRRSLNVRTTAPREGNDPDAVLSRAEAALAENDLDSALAEIAALPEVARAAMGNWLGRAEMRRQALAEAAALASHLQEGD